MHWQRAWADNVVDQDRAAEKKLTGIDRVSWGKIKNEKEVRQATTSVDSADQPVRKRTAVCRDASTDDVIAVFGLVRVLTPCLASPNFHPHPNLGVMQCVLLRQYLC